MSKLTSQSWVLLAKPESIQGVLDEQDAQIAALRTERDEARRENERLAGEIAGMKEERERMVRQFRFIRQDAASPLRRQAPATTFDGLVELCDAALAAVPPADGEDAGGVKDGG